MSITVVFEKLFFKTISWRVVFLMFYSQCGSLSELGFFLSFSSCGLFYHKQTALQLSWNMIERHVLVQLSGMRFQKLLPT